MILSKSSLLRKLTTETFWTYTVDFWHPWIVQMIMRIDIHVVGLPEKAKGAVTFPESCLKNLPNASTFSPFFVIERASSPNTWSTGASLAKLLQVCDAILRAVRSK